MTYEMYRYIFLGGAILAGIMFLVSVFVFFFLKIPTVIGDLTGSNARKAIESIRSHNERIGDKHYRTSQIVRERGKLTDKISPSGKLIKAPSRSLHGGMGTEKINTQRLSHKDVRNIPTFIAEEPIVSNETTVLTEEPIVSNETTVLTEEPIVSNETTVLSEEPIVSNETTVLTEEPIVSDETTVLNAQSFSGEFVIEYEITYIHTGEVIA